MSDLTPEEIEALFRQVAVKAGVEVHGVTTVEAGGEEVVVDF